MAGESIAAAIYKLGLENQQYIAAAKQQIQVSDQMVAANVRVADSEEKAGQASKLRANFVEAQLARGDKRIQAEERYAAQVARVKQAEEENLSTAARRQQLLDQYSSQLNKTISDLERKAKAERDAVQAEKDSETAAKNLARIESEHALALKNTITALGGEQGALIAAANAGDRHARALLELARGQVNINKELQSGAIGLREHARLNDLLQQTYRSSATSIAQQEAAMRKSSTVTGLARHEMINLSRQIQDIGVSLAGGQNPFRILVEQGSQIADIFASSRATVADFFRSIGAGIGRLGAGAVMTGIVSGIAAIGGTIITAASNFGSAQRDIQQSLLGIGRAAGVTAKDIQGIAEASASTWGASISEAREFAAALAQSGTLGNASIRDLTLVSKELAQVLGTDVVGAGKQLQQVFTDPVAGLQRLDKEMGTFDRGVAHNVETLKAQGKVFEASAVAAKALADRMKELSPEIQRTTSFWTAFGNTVSDWWDKLGQFAARRLGFGLSIEEELERAERALNDANQFFQQTGLGRELVEEAVNNFNRVTKIIETMGRSMEDIRRSRDVGAAKGMVQNIIPDIANMQKLKNEAEGLKSTLERLGTDPKFADELQRAGIAANDVALALNRVRGAQESYLPVAARLTAEYNLQLQSIDARTNAERVALAGKQREIALAGQALSASERQLEITRAMQAEEARLAAVHRDNVAALEDQLRVASALPGHAQQVAQYEADINARLREGATLMQASAEAALKLQIAVEQANRAVDQQIISLRQGVEMERARLEGTEAATEAAHAYANAMRSGASETKAAALAAATLEANLEKAQIAAERMANNIANAVPAANTLEGKLARIGSGIGGSFNLGVPRPGTSNVGGVTQGGPLVGAAGAGGVYEVNTGSIYGGPRGGSGFSSLTSSSGRVYTLDDWGRAVEKGFASFEQLIAYDEQVLAAAKSAHEAQERAAEAAQSAAEAQAEAAKAAREAAISKLDEMVADIVATKLLAGQSAQAVNMLIEQGAIQFGTASTRFQTQMDLYKRAGASNAQVAADIRAGIIGEGARPSELLAALDSLTDAVNSNTDAQLGLSPFYTSQGDRQLGYRGYTVQKGASNIPGTGLLGGSTTGIPSTGTGGVTGGMGGVVNPVQDVSFQTQPPLQLKYNYTTNTLQRGYIGANGQWVTSGPQPTLNNGYWNVGVPGSSLAGSIADSLYHQSSVSLMAEGGIVDRPTMAMMGEAGPEAVIPLRGGAARDRLAELFTKSSMPEQGVAGLLKAVNALLNRLAANENKPTVQVNAPLVHFAAEPTRDEVRQSAFQASQMLRRQMAG